MFSRFSDIFYVPAWLKHDYRVLSQLFHAHYVWLEIAVPTILYSLDEASHIQVANESCMVTRPRTDNPSSSSREASIGTTGTTTPRTTTRSSTSITR